VQKYVDARLADHLLVHDAEQRALQAATEAMAARFEGVNEFRQTLGDQAGTFVTRPTLDAIVGSINTRMDAVVAESRRAAIAAGVAAGLMGLIGGVLLARLLA
jgi:hypothetical protein